MTKQEAIETFRKFRRCNTIGCNLVTDECENCSYSTEYSAIVEATTVAIECIEKQIPIKPKKMDEMQTYRCEECLHNTMFWYEYCPICGTKFDWSEEDD